MSEGSDDGNDRKTYRGRVSGAGNILEFGDCLRLLRERKGKKLPQDNTKFWAWERGERLPQSARELVAHLAWLDPRVESWKEWSDKWQSLDDLRKDQAADKRRENAAHRQQRAAQVTAEGLTKPHREDEFASASSGSDNAVPPAAMPGPDETKPAGKNSRERAQAAFLKHIDAAHALLDIERRINRGKIDTSLKATFDDRKRMYETSVAEMFLLYVDLGDLVDAAQEIVIRPPGLTRKTTKAEVDAWVIECHQRLARLRWAMVERVGPEA